MPFWGPCGAESGGGGGAPPTTLILLRNQFGYYERRVARHDHRRRAGPGPSTRPATLAVGGICAKRERFFFSVVVERSALAEVAVVGGCVDNRCAMWPSGCLRQPSPKDQV